MTMQGLKHTPKTLEKMRRNHKGMSGKKHSVKSRQKISKALEGNQYAVGRNHTPWNKGMGISKLTRALPSYKRRVYRKRRAWLDSLKNVPCKDCGGRYPPECMDFDHIKGKKEFGIHKHPMTKKERLLKEIAKCQIVCANCHRIRTRKSNLLRKRRI